MTPSQARFAKSLLVSRLVRLPAARGVPVTSPNPAPASGSGLLVASQGQPCEHPFVTAQGSPATRYRRAVETGSVFLAELAAREMGSLPLRDALGLVALYAECEPAKFERAALRWLERLLLERADLTLGEVQLAAAALSQLPSRPEAGDVLARLAAR